MNYEIIKAELIKTKKEELNYIDNITKISNNKILSETEKLDIYRILNSYKKKLTEIFKNLYFELIKNKQAINIEYEDVIIEFDVNKNFLSSLKFSYKDERKYFLNNLSIDEETLKFKLTFHQLLYIWNNGYSGIYSDILLNNQKLIEKPIYIFSGIYDSSEECYGPCFGKQKDYLYGIYENVYHNEKKEVKNNDIDKFEKDNIIIYAKKYVYPPEIKKIFKEELLNSKNQTLNDCINQTKNRIEKLDYTRSPEYKEKNLLDKINKLYKKVKGELIQTELLYSGNFLQILRETYRLPNKNIVSKEKIIKNDEKNSVIVIAITQNKEYIITIQNRINNKLIVEFPSGYIENNENPINAAKRELQEETGYISDDLFIVDEAYTSPGTDNSKTYIVIANNCIKTSKKITNSTEFVDYELFKEKELEYLINNNIMSGAMNKLAYYNLVNNVEDYNNINIASNQKIYKKLKRKTNPL